MNSLWQNLQMNLFLGRLVVLDGGGLWCPCIMAVSIKYEFNWLPLLVVVRERGGEHRELE